MSFKLSGVIPWGRSLDEYRLMFRLDDSDMQKKIAGFGDGPASFNCEATRMGCSVTSFDPIYSCTKDALQKRIDEVRKTVMVQMRENADNYVWTNIKSIEQLENIRMSVMRLFLSDYEQGRREKRYICHSLPDRLPYEDNSFDIGLSSHFLLLFPDLGYDFHIKAISEMLRACREIRIFPLVDLNADETELTSSVVDYFKKDYSVEIVASEYEFLKGANKVLIIR